MSQQSTIAIPTFYRIFFTWLNPLVSLSGVYMDFFAPDMVLNAYIPNSPRNPDHDMLFQQLGGELLYIAFIDAVLLRYTDDINIWKIAQCAGLLADLVLGYSVWAALGAQGRLLHPATAWRGEDWGCIGILVVSTLVRTLFLAEVGLRRRVVGRKRA